MEDVSMSVIPQTQFTPLPEVLCLVISQLNRATSSRFASLEAILQELAHLYHGMQQPSEQLVYQALGSLCSEGNVYHTGNAAFLQIVALRCRRSRQKNKIKPFFFLNLNESKNLNVVPDVGKMFTCPLGEFERRMLLWDYLVFPIATLENFRQCNEIQ